MAECLPASTVLLSLQWLALQALRIRAEQVPLVYHMCMPCLFALFCVGLTCCATQEKAFIPVLHFNFVDYNLQSALLSVASISKAKGQKVFASHTTPCIVFQSGKRRRNFYNFVLIICSEPFGIQVHQLAGNKIRSCSQFHTTIHTQK
jgi:hypothetical protein